MQTFDIVIPLGDGSTAEDNELRFALRSVSKHYPNHGSVYIIGRKPAWVRNVCHIKATDAPGMQHKERNIMNKILLACKGDVTREFLFMNDDHFIARPLQSVPYLYQQSLKESIDSRSSHDHYYYSLGNTLNALRGRNVKTLNYDIHTPIIYDKKEFPRVMGWYNWDIAYGYVIKSLYANSVRIQGEQQTDLKINERLNCFQLEKRINGRQFFSIGDRAIGPDLFIYLNYLYPNKSEFE
jgi:hypothetical protein